MNFFNWIREGVRQAVLYGVHDAVGELGPPHSGQDMNERILHLLRTSPEGETPRLDGPSAAGWHQAKAARPHPGRHPGHDGSQRVRLFRTGSRRDAYATRCSRRLRYNLHPLLSAPFDVRWRGQGCAMSGFAHLLMDLVQFRCRGGHHRPCASGGYCRGGARAVSWADRRRGRLRARWAGILSALCRPARWSRPDLPALPSSHPLG